MYQNYPPDNVSEFEYLPGMLPPVLLAPDFIPVGTNMEESKSKRRGYARRKALTMTLLPIILAILCYFAWSAALMRINNG